MQKPYLVLSTCGTSVLALSKAQTTHDTTLIRKHANVKHEGEIPQKDRDELNALIADAQQASENGSWADVRKQSAELNGLIGLLNHDIRTVQHEHWLICTDTWLGEQSANIVKSWLDKQGAKVQIKRCIDLQTEDLNAFQMALSELVQWCGEYLPAQQQHYRIVFNLTGGFRSVQGFLQTLAMFYADETVYIFEHSSELLRTPRLPITITANETITNHLTSFRRLNLDLDDANAGQLPETMTWRIDEQITLSAWGKLIWEQAKPELYSGQVYESPSHRIRFGPKFPESVKAYADERGREINEKIDDLMRHLEKGTANIKSLDLKRLKGNPLPPSTHELDAWHNGGARRMFGHFEDDVFVLDRLGKALH